ncbi:uncharacterized protein [Lolium perenne]
MEVGLAKEAVAEAAGPVCIVPGQKASLCLMGFKVKIVELKTKVDSFLNAISSSAWKYTRSIKESSLTGRASCLRFHVVKYLWQVVMQNLHQAYVDEFFTSFLS